VIKAQQRWKVQPSAKCLKAQPFSGVQPSSFWRFIRAEDYEIQGKLEHLSKYVFRSEFEEKGKSQISLFY
jgi:hypothetical protein